MRWWPWGCSTGTARAATPTRPKAIAISFVVSPPILAGCCDISTSDENWDRLCRALITGESQSALGTKDYSEFYADERTQQIFLEGMSASSLIAARSLAAQFPWSRYRTFIDIGMAQGCVPVEIARAHPHLRGGGFDLPEIGPAFTSYVASQQLSDRLTFYPGDFFTDPLPQADVLIMGRILHNWGVSSRVALV